MVTIIGHILINFFQKEHISAVKFDRGYDKNMSVLVIPKSPKVLKNAKKIRLGSFKACYKVFQDYSTFNFVSGGNSNYFLMGCATRGLKALPICKDFSPSKNG